MTAMVCGGTYESVDPSGKVLQGTMVSVTVDKEGNREGTLMLHGYAPERVAEDSHRFVALRLVGRPASPKMGRPRKV